MHFLIRTSSIILLLCIHFIAFAQSGTDKRDFYELKIYYLKADVQEETIDEYLKQAYLPAVHRAGVSEVGVFKTIQNDPSSQKAVYVLIPHENSQGLFELKRKLEQDEDYLKKGESYLNAPHDNPPYDRLETILLTAFEGHPNYKKPNLTSPREKRVYELRSYESPTERIFENKVKMFNDGDEIGLFDKLGFNAVFYGEVVAGCHMPNLMYMTTFEDKASRDKHWESFGKDPFWKELSSDPQYQNNVSHIDIVFLTPTEYSDL